MTFFTQLKCALCPRWSCHARYKIGNRTYYSYLGFVSTQCPKKKYSYLTMDEIAEKALERKSANEQQEKFKRVQNRNKDKN